MPFQDRPESQRPSLQPSEEIIAQVNQIVGDECGKKVAN